ncbi:MAG: hypothetical protein HQL53_06930 [Magnetococcales bacterium]|nr:hypothetical protein [Magnetococcales bacterium]
MSDELIKMVETATETSANWAQTGWSMAFGFGSKPINSLPEAEKAPETNIGRQEALAYWQMVERTGQEAAECGTQAKEALAKGDKWQALQSAYFAMHKEKMLLERTTTWKSVVDALR